ncbi:MAG: RraA family protein [Planctomycetota bacterium]|jgi:regulator of RNase E activity RraA
MAGIDKDILARYRAVRLADVSDALDCLGYMDRYIMSGRMRPLWEGVRFAGLAHTVKLLPSSRVIPAMSYEQYNRTLIEMCDGAYDWGANVAEDEVIVVDAEGIRGGLFGSDNVLGMMAAGVAGIVIDGACRDAAEVRLERAPVFCTTHTCAHVYGRLQGGSENQPINCAGVPVEPGDLVMGDDDGVLVVPQRLAADAIQIAEAILKGDKQSRRGKYEALGMELDETVT